MQDSRYRDLR